MGRSGSRCVHFHYNCFRLTVATTEITSHLPVATIARPLITVPSLSQVAVASHIPLARFIPLPPLMSCRTTVPRILRGPRIACNNCPAHLSPTHHLCSPVHHHGVIFSVPSFFPLIPTRSALQHVISRTSLATAPRTAGKGRE